MNIRRLRGLAALPMLAALAACHAVVLHPAGAVAARQRDLLVEATALMLIVIIPVMAATALFAWRYRASNRRARYQPDWDHSLHLELVIWSVPLLIVICLGAITWVGTHLLDPYRPLAAAATSDPASGAAAQRAEPLQVDVVALDWKWLFIYPQYDVATVNVLAAPVGRPIHFRITASSVMNSFFIPALAGQIYAMAGMQTQLHAVLNRPGEYTGFSANYSGAGFSDMRFAFHGLASGADFERWIAGVKRSGATLSRTAYLALARPSEDEPVHRYAAVAPHLFDAILGMCVAPGRPCVDGMDTEAEPSVHVAPLLGAGLTPPGSWSLQSSADRSRHRAARRPRGS